MTALQSQGAAGSSVAYIICSHLVEEGQSAQVRACRLPDQRDVAWVTTKAGNVIHDPGDAGVHVLQHLVCPRLTCKQKSASGATQLQHDQAALNPACGHWTSHAVVFAIVATAYSLILALVLTCGKLR